MRRPPLKPVLATALIVAVPASSAPPAGPETQVWIDVATHSMAGMPDLGALGGLAGRMMGGEKGPQGYPQSRSIPAGQGRLLDIAMHNRLQPGTPAEQAVPAGLGVGKSLSLLPPTPGRNVEETEDHELHDIEVTIRQYWGCGASVRAGQPKVMTLKIRNGQFKQNGAIAPGLFVPDRDIDVNPSYALWPNQKNSRRVGERASMVGQHRITGAGVPASLQFELGQNADFMPKIALQTRGEMTDSIGVSWQPVDRAKAYFLNAMAMQDERNFTVWSSAEVPGAGHELVNYLTGSYIDKWLKQKVLLAPGTTSCAIPQGIFKSTGKGEHGGMASLNMIAYGPETNLVWPPKPTDPKQPWDPEWNVRVRTKATTVAMLGMDLGEMGGMPTDDGDEAGKQDPDKKEEGGAKKLLRGLMRNF